MTENTFEKFYENIIQPIEKSPKNDLMIRIEKDLESNIIRIYGENAGSVTRAKSGLDEVSELAVTTAEHHPFWALLFHCSQISKISLEKWDADLTKDDLSEISWSIDELKHACKKLQDSTNHD